MSLFLHHQHHSDYNHEGDSKTVQKKNNRVTFSFSRVIVFFADAPAVLPNIHVANVSEGNKSESKTRSFLIHLHVDVSV